MSNVQAVRQWLEEQASAAGHDFAALPPATRERLIGRVLGCLLGPPPTWEQWLEMRVAGAGRRIAESRGWRVVVNTDPRWPQRRGRGASERQAVRLLHRIPRRGGSREVWWLVPPSSPPPPPSS